MKQKVTFLQWPLQESTSREMNILKDKLVPVEEDKTRDDPKMILLQFKKEFEDFRNAQAN